MVPNTTVAYLGIGMDAVSTSLHWIHVPEAVAVARILQPSLLFVWWAPCHVSPCLICLAPFVT